MSKLYNLFVKTYNLSERTDKEYFDCIKDYYYTEEFQSMSRFSQHGSVDRVQHISSVAYVSYRIAKKYNMDYCKTARGALLHDLFYYDWRDSDPSHKLHGINHPKYALKNARVLSAKYNIELTLMEENIIVRHMFPLTIVPPKYREAMVVSTVDKYVAVMEMLVYVTEKLGRKIELAEQ